MKKVVLRTDCIDAVSWPSNCICCGQEKVQENFSQYKVKVVKGVGATLTSTPKELLLPVCGICAGKITKLQRIVMLSMGVGVLFVLISVFFPTSSLSTDAAFTIKGTFGALFGLMIFVAYIFGSMWKRMIGSKILRISKDKWSFSFRNATYAGVFQQCNSSKMS